MPLTVQQSDRHLVICQQPVFRPNHNELRSKCLARRQIAWGSQAQQEGRKGDDAPGVSDRLIVGTGHGRLDDVGARLCRRFDTRIDFQYGTAIGIGGVGLVESRRRAKRLGAREASIGGEDEAVAVELTRRIAGRQVGNPGIRKLSDPPVYGALSHPAAGIVRCAQMDLKRKIEGSPIVLRAGELHLEPR